MQKVMAYLAIIPSVVMAQELPLIIGTMPNKDNAKITFTTYQGECKGNDKVVFTQADGGKVMLTGCYRLVGDDLFVVWSDGDIYTYPVENLVFSSDAQKYLRNSR